MLKKFPNPVTRNFSNQNTPGCVADNPIIELYISYNYILSRLKINETN